MLVLALFIGTCNTLHEFMVNFCEFLKCVFMHSNIFFKVGIAS